MASVLNNDGTFPNNQRADVMRNSIENKNLLSKKGSMYIGTGGSHSVSSENVSVAETTSLDPPVDGNDTILDNYVPVTDHTAPNGISYKNLNSLDVHSASMSTKTSSIYVTGLNGLTSGYKNIVICRYLPSQPDSNTVYMILGE